MKIERDLERETALIAALCESFTEERTGVHVSDLLKVRQAAWSRAIPLPITPTEMLYFLAGRGHEEVFARLAGVVVGASPVRHSPIPGLISGEQRLRDGISYRPDFRWDGAPCEFKTRRANLAKPGEEPLVYDNYLEQLKAYATLDGSSRGFLVVFSLLEGRSNDPLKPTRPALVVYQVQFSVADTGGMRQHLAARRAQFEASLGSGLPSADLPLCPPWMCGVNRKTVTQPARCVQCDKTLQEPWASKHTETRTGAGHEVRPEVATWAYEPRCKWYAFCQPQQMDPSRGAR